MLTQFAGRMLFHLISPPYREACGRDFLARERPSTWLSQAIHKEIARRYYRLDDAEKRRLNRQMFWGSDAGLGWHRIKQKRYSDFELFEQEFLRFRKPLAQQIAHLLARCPEFHTLCHIGAGHGLFLEYLAKQLPQIRRFVGIDICREQIRITRERYRGSSLEFVNMETTDWIRDNAGDGGVIFITIGTLQYFTPQEFQELLRAVREKIRPGAIALSETVNIRLTSAAASVPRGDLGYSHPYPEILRQERYQLFQYAMEPVDASSSTANQLMLTATTQPVPKVRPGESSYVPSHYGAD